MRILKKIGHILLVLFIGIIGGMGGDIDQFKWVLIFSFNLKSLINKNEYSTKYFEWNMSWLRIRFFFT